MENEAVKLDTAFSKIVNDHHQQPLVDYYRKQYIQMLRDRTELSRKLRCIDWAILKERRTMRVMECVIVPIQILAVILMVNEVLSFRTCCFITYGLLVPLIFHAGRWFRAYITRKEVLRQK